MGRSLSPIFPAWESEDGEPFHQNRRRKLIAFGWYGGKFSHLEWLLPQLPECHHYCEPFSGSAAVLLNREPSPVETYNDIDGEVAGALNRRMTRSGGSRHTESLGHGGADEVRCPHLCGGSRESRPRESSKSCARHKSGRARA